MIEDRILIVCGTAVIVLGVLVAFRATIYPFFPDRLILDALALVVVFAGRTVIDAEAEMRAARRRR